MPKFRIEHPGGSEVTLHMAVDEDGAVDVFANGVQVLCFDLDGTIVLTCNSDLREFGFKLNAKNEIVTH